MLKAVVTDINTVAENLRDLYAEKDGKFVLKVESAEGFALENVEGLKTALNAERSAHAAAKNALKPFEGLDPTTVRTAIDRANAFGDLDPTVVKTSLTAFDRLSKLDPEKEAERLAEEKLKNSKTQLVSTFNEEKTRLSADLAEAKAKLAKRDEQVNKLLKKTSISTELAKLNPIDEARDVLEMIAEQSVKLVDVDGEARPVVVDSAGNPRTKLGANYESLPLTVADLMSEIREQRQSLFKPEKAVGGIGTGGTGAARTTQSGDYNPWSKATPNLTQQVMMTANDPQRAARLRAEAGV